jgi:hypothetical protein
MSWQEWLNYPQHQRFKEKIKLEGLQEKDATGNEV